jgi:hypothetical protein
MLQLSRRSNMRRLSVAGAAIVAVALGFRLVLRVHHPTIAALTYCEFTTVR